MRRLSAAVFALVLGACGRHPDTRRFEIGRPNELWLAVVDSASGVCSPISIGDVLPAGRHALEMRENHFWLDGKTGAPVMPGAGWQWLAMAHEPFKPVVRARISQPGSEPANFWPASGGVPTAVLSSGDSVFVGSGAGESSGAVVALDQAGHALWNHRRAGFGVHALGADGGALFVLADAARAVSGEVFTNEGGSDIYKLDAKTGEPLAWTGGAPTLSIASLWPKSEGADANSQPDSADAMAVANGRIYLSFSQPGFIAVLDAADGHYVTTLSGPSPGQLALSTTPMRGADGELQLADFGIAVLARSALTYFVMPHDPPWVAYNTTHRLPEDEQVTAFTMLADTLQSGEVELYLALAAPQSQVQRRFVADPSGYTLAVGKTGGRSEALGPWDKEALREVRSVAAAPDGKLWIAEGEAWPPRFTLWSVAGGAPRLVREFFVPTSGPETRGAAIFPNDPSVVVAAGCEWRVELKTGALECAGVITQGGMREASFFQDRERVILAVGDDSPALTFYERTAPGRWRTLSQLTKLPGGDVIYWADADGDGQRKSTETQRFKAGLVSHAFPDHVLPDGTLGSHQMTGGFPLTGWNVNGAPLFGFADSQVHTLAPEAPERVLFGHTLPDLASLMRTADGRVFFLKRDEGGLSLMELDGAQTLRTLGTGTLGN